MAELTVSELNVKIGLEKDGLRKDLRKLQGDLKKEGTESAKGFGASFKSAIASVGIAFALKKAFDFAGLAKDAARDADEIASKFGTVFESIGNKAELASKQLSKNFDLASTTAKELLGTTGDLLVGFGFTEEKALDLSKQVQELAIDVASFSNFSGGAKGASEALTKALLGETESAKSLGIVIRQNTQEFRDQVAELQRTEGMSVQQAKAQVILGQAYAQSQKAVGDYTRTSRSLANEERALQERFKESLEIIGRELVPAYGVFNSVMKGLLDLIFPVKNAIKEEAKQVNILARELANSETSQERRVQLYGKLKAINPDIVRGIDAESVSVDTLTKNLARFNQELIKRIIIQKQQDKIADVAADAADEQIKLLEIREEAESALTEILLKKTAQLEKSNSAFGNVQATKELEEFNKVMLSNLTVEEKIQKLQSSGIIGKYTNFWNNLTNRIDWSRESLKEYQTEFDALTTGVAVAQKEFGQQPIAPELTDLIPSDLEDIVLPDEVITEFISKLDGLNAERDALVSKEGVLTDFEQNRLRALNDEIALVNGLHQARLNLRTVLDEGVEPLGLDQQEEGLARITDGDEFIGSLFDVPKTLEGVEEWRFKIMEALHQIESEKDSQQNDSLTAAVQLGQTLITSFRKSGNVLLDTLQQGLQIALSIATAINSANPLGIVSSIVGGAVTAYTALTSEAPSSSGSSGGVINAPTLPTIPTSSNGGSGANTQAINTLNTTLQAQELNRQINRQPLEVVVNLDGQEVGRGLLPEIDKLTKQGFNG